MIARTTVFNIGLAQLICWGTSYYLVGGLGQTMAADLGWKLSVVQGGFSIALVVMGLVSPLVGRAIDRRGGRPVMVVGSLVLAAGCVGLALSHRVVTHYIAWIVLGVAMRLTLYDAAFAALARIGGPHARRPISHVTLLGGLASTAFWPIGHGLAEAFGWRGALLGYAAFALVTVPLHLSIPPGTWQAAPIAETSALSHSSSPSRDTLEARILYASIVTLTAFLNSGMSAHMIGLLGGLGAGASLAVWMSSLRGIGQSGARLCEVLFGSRMSAFTLAVLASTLLLLSFVFGLFGGRWALAGCAFAFLYGTGAGLHTIVRGTLPLVLFNPVIYGRVVGSLLVPSFLVSALAPIALALVAEHLGPAPAIHLSTIFALTLLILSTILRQRHRPG